MVVSGFSAHESNTLMDLSKTVSTREYLAKLKVLNKSDLIKSCSREKNENNL